MFILRRVQKLFCITSVFFIAFMHVLSHASPQTSWVHNFFFVSLFIMIYNQVLILKYFALKKNTDVDNYTIEFNLSTV